MALDPRIRVDQLPGFRDMSAHPRERPANRPTLSDASAAAKAARCSVCGVAITLPTHRKPNGQDYRCRDCLRPITAAVNHGASPAGIRAKLKARRAAEANS